MASSVHSLPDGSPLQDTDELYIARAPFAAGDDFKVTVAELKVLFGGGSDTLYDHTLVAPASSFDPGANSIPAGYSYIECLFMGAAAQATGVTTGSTGIQVNADAGASYRFHSLLDFGNSATAASVAAPVGGATVDTQARAAIAAMIPSGVAPSPSYSGSNNMPGGPTSTADNVMRINLPGANAGAGAVGFARAIFYNYDNSTFLKLGQIQHGVLDPTGVANLRMRLTQAHWANSAVITRLAMINLTNNFITGSRFTIIGHK